MITRSVRNGFYRITLGPVSYLPWNGTNPSQANRASEEVPGIPQDAIIEVWTSHLGQVRDDGTEFGTRLVQRAALLNTCTHPCSVSPNENNRALGVCDSTMENTHAYHRIVDPASFGNLPECITGQRRVGNIDTNYCNDGDMEDDIDPIDITVLRNYILSGSQQGSCALYLHGNIPGQFSIPCVDSTGSTCNDGAAANIPCGDLNSDQSIDEVDLSILEKILRGYLNGVPF